MRFQSTHPLRGATACVASVTSNSSISIHAPLAGCDCRSKDRRSSVYYFNPRTPCGVRRSCPRRSRRPRSFQSTHPLRGATLFPASCRSSMPFQSTHPLRGATASFRAARTLFTFQSTHPLRGATRLFPRRQDALHISIHAPLAGCDDHAAGIQPRAGDFNPRTPCGVRLRRVLGLAEQHAFQSTHPLRGATPKLRGFIASQSISIHAPLAGCDNSGAAP